MKTVVTKWMNCGVVVVSQIVIASAAIGGSVAWCAITARIVGLSRSGRSLEAGAVRTGLEEGDWGPP